MSLADVARPAGDAGSFSQLTSALGAAVILVAVSDWLFWGHALGMSAAVWVIAVILVALIVNWRELRVGAGFKALLIAFIAVAPLIETINVLSITIAAFGLSAAALAACGAQVSRWPKVIFQPIELLCLGPFRLIPDLVIAQEGGHRFLPNVNFSGWVVPIVFSLIFLLLFYSANPLIDNWISALHISRLWEMLSVPRIIFWGAALSVAWGFVRARVVKWDDLAANKNLAHDGYADVQPKSKGAFSRYFNPTSVLRSLVMFNLLFAVQSGLDIMYLWRGVALPEGMNYAAYAHRGAYPLMITAALAAVFVVVTFGPGKSLESSPLARGLVFAWIAQNVLLVISSIQRLSLYVEVYALSYWRISAFIWMGLVAVGLVLIMVRIAGRRSNEWLIGANATVVCMVLYACCFINFPRVISDYNVAHSRELSGEGVRLDLRYIKSLGYHATPALMRYTSHRTNNPRTGWPEEKSHAIHPIFCLVKNRLEERLQSWRAWTYRDYRLNSYLKARVTKC